MKRHILYSLALGIVLTALAGCGKFGDINRDPNNPSNNDTRYLLLRAEQGVTGAVFSESSLAPSTNLYNPWAQFYPQYFGEGKNIQYTALNINNGSASNYYTIFLRNLKVIIDANNDKEQASSAFVSKLGPNKDQIAICKTLKAYYMMTITDIYGMMPYTEMIKGEEGNFTPKFDSMEEIYTGLDKELQEAYATMSDRKTIDPTFDIIYGGDMSKWKKLNASLRMCLAIKLSDVAPDTGKARFAAAYRDGALSDNEDNMVYPYLPENSNANPVYVNYFIDRRVDFYPTSTLVNAFLDLKDGRVLAYAKPNLDNKNNPITGAPWGYDKQEMGNFKQENPLSFLADNLTKQDYHLVLISAAKVKLMCAEAALRGWISADPEALYEEAIRLSFEEKNVAGIAESLRLQEAGDAGTVLDAVQSVNHLLLSADEYLAQPKVKLSGSTEEKIKQVAYQRWLNGFMQHGVEAWSDWRRLGVPELKVGGYAEQSGITHIPYRRVLSTDDWDQNRDNYNAMVSAQGENSIDTRIWWDVK